MGFVKSTIEDTKLYYELMRIRKVEEKIANVYPSDRIKSPIHLSIGQESVSVGFCQALTCGDYVFGTYRSHALYLAKGGDLCKMIAELYGKVSGCGRGKAGSMHLADVDHGIIGTSAVVGTSIPNAVGFAQALQYKNTNNLVVCFLGDGATEEGVFFESLNYAALKKLPVLFVCENNQYAIHSPQSERQANTNIVDKVSSFGITSRKIENPNIWNIYNTAAEVVTLIKESAGPVFIECPTYRWLEHVGPNEDFHLEYRDRQESVEWVQNDDIKKLSDVLDTEVCSSIDEQIDREIAFAFDYAENSDFPDKDELLLHLFK